MSKKKILIVDDEPQNLHVLMEIIKKDYAVAAATNGEKALELAAKDPVPNLIFLDISMPGMDGFEVLAKLKSNDVTKDIPVIFVSAEEKLDAMPEEAKKNSAGYLTKPVDPEAILDAIRSKGR
ncbi:MAG: response regulator [bacterium]|nr:response regulator [bacterium]